MGHLGVYNSDSLLRGLSSYHLGFSYLPFVPSLDKDLVWGDVRDWLDEERLCLCPPIKLLTNNLLNSSKELTVLGGILLNHTRASPLRVVGKALHIISSGTP